MKTSLQLQQNIRFNDQILTGYRDLEVWKNKYSHCHVQLIYLWEINAAKSQKQTKPFSKEIEKITYRYGLHAEGEYLTQIYSKIGKKIIIMTEVLIKGPSVGVYSEKDQQSTNRPYLWIMRIYSLARNLFMIRYSLARNLF